MSRLRHSASSLLAVLIVVVSTTAAAHTLKTARGALVIHYHYAGDCISGTMVCGSSWSTVEKQVGFRPADRMYTGSIAWNCHGRTFDFRRSWVPLADDFLRTDSPMCPAKPAKGDTIIWIYGNTDAAKDRARPGNTKHSVTIDGPWLGLDTIVVSKYGAAGQYRHALRNSVAVYGTAWTVTRFGAGTAISASAINGGSDVHVSMAREVGVVATPADELLSARESMPWYPAVQESENVYAAARKQQVRKAGVFLPETVNALKFSNGAAARIALLMSDLKNPEHYAMLSMYNFPEPELLTGFAAADELRAIASKNADNYADILSALTSVASDLALPDPVRGEALHVLHTVALPDDARKALESLDGRGVLAASGDESYTAYFASRLAPAEVEPRRRE